MNTQKLDYSVLELDTAKEIEHIAARMREVLGKSLKRRGLVVAISGGIDSSCSVALAVRAVGAERVLALILPEHDSSDFSANRANVLAKHLGIEVITQNIGATLEAIGCYRWRDEAIRRVIPAYGAGWKMKITIKGGLDGQVNHFRLITQDPSGAGSDTRLPVREYLQIVAATNFKQRIRKTLEYFHADRLNYAVVGTPNRLEYDQGFFVKNGDGSADVKPIAHLYKTQVYAMARALGLPADVCAAEPTTDTYTLPQGQDEFYFALPHKQMDLALWALNHGVPAAELAGALSLTPQQAEWIYQDIAAKRRTTRYMHLPPQLIDEVAELDF
jgi:NAD+ synthase